MLPLPKFVKEFETLVGILFILIVITGLILYIKNRTPGFSRSKAFEHLSHKKFTFYVYGFLSLWVVSHIIVFITVSQRSFRVRYTYIAAYGLIALLVISLYQIVKIVFRQKEKLICTFFLIIILISGFSRFIELKSYFKSLNRNQAMIIKNLNRFQFPENSQIVIYLESGRNFWSDWFQSSGHLKYMLKRDDIDGLIGSKNGRYFNFYNPFDKETRGFGPNHWMKGINIQRPLFLFVEKNKKFKQYHYALQWKNNTSESQWTIFHFDKKTGKASSVLSGTGREDYDSALGRLKRTGITPKDILWGGQTVLQ